jgi:hypothetical protein
MGLFCVGFIVLAVVSYVGIFKRFRGFMGMVKEKQSNWDAFAARTGLQWELKTSVATPNPVQDKMFGADLANKTGRLIGNYRGYPVVVENQTRNHYSAASMMVTNQTYFTGFHLTIQNPAGLQVNMRKENQFIVEPQDVGNHLLHGSAVVGRLFKIPVRFWIVIQGPELSFVQDGVEQNPDLLGNTLEALCELADSVRVYQ